MAVLLAVVFGDFDIMGAILFPGKADSVLIVDPYAVLPGAISVQGFQPIAGRDQKIRQGSCIVQGKQAPLPHRSNIREILYGLPVEQPLRFHAGERPDHVLRIFRFDIVRQA
jgi:hypothetical protein